MFTAQEAISRLSDKREIFFDEMVDLFRQVMEEIGRASCRERV